MFELRLGDTVTVFGMTGVVVGIDGDLIQVELRTGDTVDAVVFAPIKDVRQ